MPLLKAASQVMEDIAWCKENNVDYVPIVYPGFSWHNLSKDRPGLARHTAYGAIPRIGGKFYWDLIYNAINAGTEMLYVAMYDEIDEGSAIIKVTDTPPNTADVNFVGNDGVPSDQYLFLTGKAAQMLRGEIPGSKEMPVRNK
jgi:hypothetical protein